MTYPCGCINEIDPDSGVLHCVKKCEGHIEALKNQKQDCLEYYESLGCLKNGVPQNRRYIDELEEAMEELDCFYFRAASLGPFLEIGCGLGMYVPFFLKSCCNYSAVEPNPFARDWVSNTFNVHVYDKPFEKLFLQVESFGRILAAHVIEHLRDGPAAIMKIYATLNRGGQLFVILPDDTDPVNPDHLWFFNPKTLRALLEKIGFVDIRMTMRKRIERENFIYCVASKP